MPSHHIADGVDISEEHTGNSKRHKSQLQSSSRTSKADSTNRHSPIVIDSDEDSEQEKVAGPSRVKVKAEEPRHIDGLDERESIRQKLIKLDSEIKSVKEQLEPLQRLHTSLISERRVLEQQLAVASQSTLRSDAAVSSSSSRKVAGSIDYQSSSFPWSDAAMSVLKTTFGLSSFRLCQAGVINAAMDGRDIVCVMPTGGGKSLTYQLPAIAGARGITVVISPLLALIWDQVRALKELNVECAMLTGATSKEEQNSIYKRIEEGGGKGRKELRMIYLTPEKVSKSKRLMSVLERANSDGRLKRFVIDEAHCCSQLGHDFRPDYKKLSVLKTLFPRVPIQAVTATLSSKTMPDLLKILRLAPICDGHAANAGGTIFFSAPLFRPNLLYRVLPKPSSAKAAIETIGQWINDNHPGKSGIIYCFSKKDADTLAASLTEWSKGEIKTGVYHAGIDDWEKERIHIDWRKGKINCICATIAFGMGIDKGDVRYVIHHSMSKSLEGYYQETGRAGRDGQESDCVLFYRGQDAAKLSSLVYNDVDGTGKMHEMLRFAQDLKTCRKVAFAKYFSASTQLSAAAWDHADALETSGGKITTCGICDNCTRDPATVIAKDVTLESWKILRVLQEVVRSGGRVTPANLINLVRGLGGGSFSVPAGGKRKRSEPEKATLNLDHLVGGKITLNKDDTESLLIHLNLAGYLEDSFSATAYSVNVYVVPGQKAFRLSRLSREEVENGDVGSPIECTFLNTEVKAKKTKKAGEKKLVDIDEEENQSEVEDEKPITKPKKQKAKAKQKDEIATIDNLDTAEDRPYVSDWDEDGAEALNEAYEDEFMRQMGTPPSDDEGGMDDFVGSSDVEEGWKVKTGTAAGRKGSSRAQTTYSF